MSGYGVTTPLPKTNYILKVEEYEWIWFLSIVILSIPTTSVGAWHVRPVDETASEGSRKARSVRKTASEGSEKY